jgi:Skp family chaperone for outer membrane proteins
MTQATETESRELKDLLTGMREEMRVGFANVDTKFANVTTQITRLDGRIDTLETKLDSKIDNLETKIDAKIDKLEVKIDNLETKLDSKIDKLETKIDAKIDTVNSRLTNIEANSRILLDLAEKLGELKNWKQIAIVIFTASVSGAIAWYIRSGNP